MNAKEEREVWGWIENLNLDKLAREMGVSREPVNEPEPRPYLEEAVNTLLDAGFTRTQIKALIKAGAIKP